MQEAIEKELNTIPVKSVRDWARDVQFNRSLPEILEMLVRHYSFHGDRIHICNWPQKNKVYLGRTIVSDRNVFAPSTKHPLFFDSSSWFNRYLIDRPISKNISLENIGDSRFEVYCDDAFNVLSNIEGDVFDGAVTSPPYYNAREYSKWDNIYCYLYDMYNINRQVFRCLKPGSLYLYNIFDYFDNEKSVALSAMGQRRMLLSSYAVDIFRRIGFQLLGNIVWDKGDIEGKRGFNAGNFSPYYQSPFNCWEHILIFRKPSTKRLNFNIDSLPRFLFAKPVLKMIRNRNIHGHTAPFPDEIPELIIKQLVPKSKILDPFAGSLTTGRVAERYGVNSFMVERSQKYCELGLSILNKERKQSELFQKNKQTRLRFK